MLNIWREKKHQNSIYSNHFCFIYNILVYYLKSIYLFTFYYVLFLHILLYYYSFIIIFSHPVYFTKM